MFGDLEERERRLRARRGALPNMSELQRYSVNLGQTETPSGPVDPETTKEQVRQLSDVLVYGPLLIMSGLGREPPRWVRAGMLIIGVGTVVYQLARYFDTTRNAQLGQMTHGPVHRLDELRRLQRKTADVYRGRVIEGQYRRL